MSAPPMVMSLRMTRVDHKPFRLWLPLFLLYPLLLVLVLLALVFTIVADAALMMSRQRYHHYSRLLMGSLSAMVQARGLKIYVHGDDSTVDLWLR
jgi:hypothetical protein